MCAEGSDKDVDLAHASSRLGFKRWIRSIWVGSIELFGSSRHHQGLPEEVVMSARLLWQIDYSVKWPAVQGTLEAWALLDCPREDGRLEALGVLEGFKEIV